MGDSLSHRLKQRAFSSPYQEAMLNVMVAAENLTRQLEERCAEFGVTLSQYNVLRILKGVYPEGHARCNVIERMLHFSPDVTRLIDKLVKSGFARRDRSVDDGRLSLTFITEEGLNLLEKMNDNVMTVERSLVDKLSEQEARQLSALCEKVYGSILV